MCYRLTKSISRVSRETGVSRATAGKYILNAKRAPAKKKKRTPQVTERLRELKRLALMRSQTGDRVYPTYGSAAAIRQAYVVKTGKEISCRTVQRDLKSCGLRSFCRNVVPSRNRGECKTKQLFLKRMQKKSNSYLRRIVFSDETWVSTQERTSKRMYAANRRDVLPREKKTRWNYSAFQVFAGVGIGWKSQLILLPVKQVLDGEVKGYRLNADKYIRKCLSPILPKLIRDGRVLQQDGARSHASKRTQAFLRRKKVELLQGFPAYSPELNPIEGVWRVLHNRIGKRCPLTMDELKKCAVEEWNAIDQSVIDRICTHFIHQVGAA